MGWFGRRGGALAEDWEEIVERSVAIWRLLDDDERTLLAGYIKELVETKRWEAANGFELTDRIRTVIAAQAGVLLLGLDLSWYHDVKTIIVHPSTMTFTQERSGPAGTMTEEAEDLLGETSLRGPVVIAWDSASYSARHPRRGRDVVYHEFAHKLDLLDEVVDGTPPLPDQAALDRWIDVCTRHYHELVDGDGDELIDDYGATDPGEFFAVITEVFFTRPVDLEHHKPDLYEVLRDFYRQDPAARARR